MQDIDGMDTSEITLSDVFAQMVREDLAGHLDEIIRRNRGNDDSTCATHDFCDANEIMSEAFEYTFGREPDLGNDADISAWDSAWNDAVDREFSGKKVW